MRTYEITLRIETNMPDEEVESWVSELLTEEARAHLLEGETIELEKVKAETSSSDSRPRQGLGWSVPEFSRQLGDP